MSDPVTYSFYGTTAPVLRNIYISVTNILSAAKAERANAADGKTLPSDQEILDSKFGDMLPFRLQPILMAKFALEAVSELQLSSAEAPALRPDFSTLDDVIEFYKKMIAVFDNLDEKKYNESANKPVDVPIEGKGIVLHMSGMADYYHGFVIPHSYFHLNAIYMLLRSAGFSLGKGVYIGNFMSETQQKDWAPIRA